MSQRLYRRMKALLMTPLDDDATTEHFTTATMVEVILRLYRITSLISNRMPVEVPNYVA